MREREQSRPPRLLRLSAAEGRLTRGWMQERYGVVEPIDGFNFARERRWQILLEPYADPKFSGNGGRWPGF